QDLERQLQHQPAALRRREPAPRAFIERAASRPYRQVDIRGVAPGDAVVYLASRGVEDRNGFARRAGHGAIVNEMLLHADEPQECRCKGPAMQPDYLEQDGK